MKRKCMNCEHCLISSRDNEPLSCTYGLRDGGMSIGIFCPKDKRRIRDFKEEKRKK